jgi:hypothetical protein
VPSKSRKPGFEELIRRLLHTVIVIAYRREGESGTGTIVTIAALLARVDRTEGSVIPIFIPAVVRAARGGRKKTAVTFYDQGRPTSGRRLDARQNMQLAA